LGLIVRKVLFCILAFILTWDRDAASNSPTHFSSRRYTELMGIFNPRLSSEGFSIQLIMLKQFQFKESFLSCLKATAMEKGRKASIAVCLAD